MHIESIISHIHKAKEFYTLLSRLLEHLGFARKTWNCGTMVRGIVPLTSVKSISFIIQLLIPTFFAFKPYLLFL